MNKLEEKFIKCYDELSDAIFRHCYFRVYDRDSAKDIMQETFTKTWQYLVGGGEIQNMKAFLYKTANNLIIDLSRKKQAVSLETLQEEGFEPGYDDSKDINNSIEVKRLLKLVDQLDNTYREVVIMRYIDDLSPKDIASIVHESENNISVRIHRGIKKLKELLNQNG